MSKDDSLLSGTGCNSTSINPGRPSDPSCGNARAGSREAEVGKSLIGDI
jgi:hypothetical protein